jgi:uncharacterized membrane protein YoaK (UPF0700 family)
MRLKPLAHQQRLFVEKLILAVALPAVAGAVNASGFLALGVYTSHVTGHIARIGDELAQNHAAAALGALLIVLLFFGGAITATVMIERAKRMSKARYVAPLVLQAGALIAFAVVAGLREQPGQSVALTGLLCFAMGLQNALVTKISGAVVRTTHLTGMVTDIAIESVRIAEWVQSEYRKRTFSQRFHILPLILSDPEWKKLRLHCLILSSFLVGAIVGPGLFLSYGQTAMIAPCIVLFVLAGFDLALGIRTHSDASTEATAQVSPGDVPLLPGGELRGQRGDVVRRKAMAEHVDLRKTRFERDFRDSGGEPLARAAEPSPKEPVLAGLPLRQ